MLEFHTINVKLIQQHIIVLGIMELVNVEHVVIILEQHSLMQIVKLG